MHIYTQRYRCIFYIIFVCNRLLYSNLYAIVSCTLFSLSISVSISLSLSSVLYLLRTILLD